MQNFLITIVAILVALFVWFVLLPKNATSQAVVPQEDVFLVACAAAANAAPSEVSYCRKESVLVDGLNANAAVIVKIKGGAKYRLTIDMYYSSWGIQGFSAEEVR